MAIWKCNSCGITKESKCKPKKCPNCGAKDSMIKEEQESSSTFERLTKRKKK